jgi:hypothetical protein
MYLLILIAITVSVYLYLMISKGDFALAQLDNTKNILFYDTTTNNIETLGQDRFTSKFITAINANTNDINTSQIEIGSLKAASPTYQTKDDMKNYYNKDYINNIMPGGASYHKHTRLFTPDGIYHLLLQSKDNPATAQLNLYYNGNYKSAYPP